MKNIVWAVLVMVTFFGMLAGCGHEDVGTVQPVESVSAASVDTEQGCLYALVGKAAEGSYSGRDEHLVNPKCDELTDDQQQHVGTMLAFAVMNLSAQP